MPQHSAALRDLESALWGLIDTSISMAYIGLACIVRVYIGMAETDMAGLVHGPVGDRTVGLDSYLHS